MPTQVLIDQSNRLLNFIVDGSHNCWVALDSVYLDEGAAKAKAYQLMLNKIAKLDGITEIEPIIYPASTSTAIDNLCTEWGGTILPSKAKEMWTLLKSEERIIQVGGGRGRAIAIVNTTMFPNDIAQDAHLIDPTDPKALLKALQEQVVNDGADKATYEELLRQKDKELEEAQKEKDKLTQQVHNQTRTNWT